jgi:hypothetical protein
VPNASLIILCYENIKVQTVLTVLQVRSTLCITKQVLISKTVSTSTDRCTSASQTIHYLLQNMYVQFTATFSSTLHYTLSQTRPIQSTISQSASLRPTVMSSFTFSDHSTEMHTVARDKATGHQIQTKKH